MQIGSMFPTMITRFQLPAKASEKAAACGLSVLDTEPMWDLEAARGSAPVTVSTLGVNQKMEVFCFSTLTPCVSHLSVICFLNFF